MERDSEKNGINIDMNEIHSTSSCSSPVNSAPTSPTINGVHKSMILAVDFVEFWVGNAKILSRYYCSAFGFQPLNFKSIDHGTKKRQSHVISQRDIIFVFTSSCTANDTEFNTFLQTHGDAIKDVGLRVVRIKEFFVNQKQYFGKKFQLLLIHKKLLYSPCKSNVYDAFERAISNGAKAIDPPREITDGTDGTVVIAKIAAPFGDVVHTLIDRSKYTGSGFMPSYQSSPNAAVTPRSTPFTDEFSHSSELTHIDHVTLAFEQGHLMKVLDWYTKCLGFQQFLCNDEDSQDGLTVIGIDSGLKTIVVTASFEKYSFKFVLVEGVLEGNGKTKNQIQEFIECNGGPGVQHIALHTKDMITAVDTLRHRGVEFIEVPTSYYDTLFENEAAFMKDSYKTLKDLGILLDVSNKTQGNAKQSALLMQTFTLPMQDRPTFFLEIICRKGSNGFGRRTIKALFEAVERLQLQRQLHTSYL